MSGTGGKGSGRQRNHKDPTRAGSPGTGAVEAQTTGPSRVWMDLDFVRGLVEVVDASGIDSLEISRAGTRIRIAKTPPPAPVTGVPVPPPAAGLPAPTVVPAPDTTPAATAPAAGAGEEAGEAAAPSPVKLEEVRSPMVGTFYRAPAPEAPPYVEVGSHVTKGQTLCILEAMKLMNELESEIDGIVREILVENAEPVEYGQLLFRIEPTGS